MTTATTNKDETSILHFRFHEKIPILIPITNSKNIKFVRRKEKDNTYVTGFKIIIKESTPKKITDAKGQTAPRLTNILSSITGLEINYKPPIIKFIRNGETTTRTEKTVGISWSRDIGIDNLDISKLSSSLLNKHSKLNLQLAHAHNGHRAFLSKDFPQAIREFYLVFEYTGRLEHGDYRNLRNFVSHSRLNKKDTINELRTKFHLPIQANRKIDLDNPKIKGILGGHARELRRKVGLYLNGQLKNKLDK